MLSGLHEDVSMPGWLSGPRYGRCPECGSENVKKILYGLPDGLEHGPGHLVAGGCLVSGNDPTRCCGDCGSEWGRPHPLPEEDAAT